MCQAAYSARLRDERFNRSQRRDNTVNKGLDEVKKTRKFRGLDLAGSEKGVVGELWEKALSYSKHKSAQNDLYMFKKTLRRKADQSALASYPSTVQ